MTLRNITILIPASQARPAVPLFEDFHLSIQRGSTLVLMGASGVGKSTLASIVAGIAKPNGGELVFGDVELRQPFAYVDQTPFNVVFPWLSVLGNIEYPLKKLHWVPDVRRTRTEALLEAFMLTSVASSSPSALSGGELQRLALARALSWRPALVIVDEGFSGLDIMARPAILKAFRECVKDANATALVITHSPSDAVAVGERYVILSDRPVRIVEDLGIAQGDLTSEELAQVLWRTCDGRRSYA